MELLTMWSDPLLSEHVAQNRSQSEPRRYFYSFTAKKESFSVFSSPTDVKHCTSFHWNSRNAQKVLFRANGSINDSPWRLATWWKQLRRNSVMLGTTRTVQKQRQQESYTPTKSPPLVLLSQSTLHGLERANFPASSCKVTLDKSGTWEKRGK